MFSCECGFTLERYAYPIYCKCGRVHVADGVHTANCPHLVEDACEIASEIAERKVNTLHVICAQCTACPRPQRLNAITLTLAFRHNPAIDMNRAQEIIDNDSDGFGARLANTLGLVVQPSPGCGCAGHRDILDVWTKEYIQKNMNKVLDWLERAARVKQIPFSRVLTKLLISSLLLAYREPRQQTKENAST